MIGSFTPDQTDVSYDIHYIETANGSYSDNYDYLYEGSSSSDSINISTGSGRDILIGGSGNDTLNGGSGSDTIYSGSGDDQIIVSDGSGDIIDAGSGDDTITIASVTNAGLSVDGGTGFDTLDIDFNSISNSSLRWDGLSAYSDFASIHEALAGGIDKLVLYFSRYSNSISNIELPAGSVATWENSAALPSGWNLWGNTEKVGEFILGGMGLTALSSGSVKLGTLTLTAPTNPQHFELLLTAGELGNDTVPAFGIASESMTTGSDGLYEHLDMPEGTYALISSKVSGTTESNAITAQDALAALKMAVGMNPNGDGSDVLPYQFLAADVNKDGLVKATDALNILKMAVGLPSAPANEWLFVPESVGCESMTRTHVEWPGNPLPVTLDMDQELPLIGIVKGDVDGSWAA